MIKKVIPVVIFATGCVLTNAQTPNWQNKDLKTDTVFGISTEKAYSELLKGKKSKTVLVAVIDSGVDTAHEDLRTILWINPKEKANGKDDDKNGYTDDLHGWDFIGGGKRGVDYYNLEIKKNIRRGKKFFFIFFFFSILYTINK